MLSLAASGVFLGGRAAYAVDFGVRESGQEWPAVVALARGTGAEDGAPFRIFCSGVVIHPQYVLTAAHCVQEGSIRPGEGELKKLARSLRVHFGPGDTSRFVAADLAQVERIRIHPKYMRELRGWSDLALLRLKSPAPIAPEKIPPLLLDIATLRQKLLPGLHLKLVGFGYAKQAVGGEIFGLKHSGELRIEGKTANEIQIVGGKGRNILEVMGARDGDSGGPIFYEDEKGIFHVAGTVSRATQLNHGPFGTVFSLVRGGVCWLEREIGASLKVSYTGPDYCDQDSSLPFPAALANKNFRDYCRESAQLPISSRYTIHVLQELYGASDCAALGDKLDAALNVSLDATFITDARVLAGLPTLERLSLRDNDIESVAALEGLRSLRLLDISYNNVRDFGGVNGLESAGLWLVGRHRQDWNMGRTAFIRACSSPETTEAARTTIDAVFKAFEIPVGACVNANYELIRIRRLEFYRTKGLTDMSPLAGLHALDKLDLNGQSVADLGFLASLPELDHLILDGNPARDISAVLQLKNLRELSLQNMGLGSLPALADLRQLRILKISGNRVKDLSTISELESRGVRVEGKEQQISD